MTARRDVLLEAAHFTPAAVAGRARRLGLLTDAAQRFERGVDPSLPPIALERATALLLEIAGGEAGPVAGDAGGEAPAAVEWVSLRRSRLARLLGATVSRRGGRRDPGGDQRAGGSRRAQGWRVRRPPHRFDIRIEEDLIEEVARLRGFDSIAEAHAIAPQIAGYATETRVSNERLLTAMADRGYREAITYTFVDPVAAARSCFPRRRALALVESHLGGLERDARVAVERPGSRVPREHAPPAKPRAAVRDRQEVRRRRARRAARDRDARRRRHRRALAGAMGQRARGAGFLRREGAMSRACSRSRAMRARCVSRPTRCACLRPGRSARIWRNERRRSAGSASCIRAWSRPLSLSNTLFLFELEIESAFTSKHTAI